MQKLSHYAAAFQILLAFWIIAITSLIITGWSMSQVWVAEGLTRDMRGEQDSLAQVEDTQVALLEQEIMEKAYLLTGTQSYLDEHARQQQIADDHLAQAARSNVSELEQASIGRLTDARNAYESTFDQVVAAYKRGDKAEAIRLCIEVSVGRLAQAQTEVESLMFMGETDLRQRVEEVDSTIRRATLVSVIGLIAFPILGVWAFIISTQSTLPFLAIQNAAIAIAGKNYRPELLDNVVDSPGGLGLMARNLKQTADKLATRQAALQAEVDALTEELQEIRRRRLVTGVPGQQAHHDEQRRDS
jgi:CHASE3 domain sensor protein